MEEKIYNLQVSIYRRRYCVYAVLIVSIIVIHTTGGEAVPVCQSGGRADARQPLQQRGAHEHDEVRHRGWRDRRHGESTGMSYI
jgi:hypothetical protein